MVGATGAVQKAGSWTQAGASFTLEEGQASVPGLKFTIKPAETTATSTAAVLLNHCNAQVSFLTSEEVALLGGTGREEVALLGGTGRGPQQPHRPEGLLQSFQHPTQHPRSCSENGRASI